jgi:anaphase-promoting complex subunit 2
MRCIINLILNEEDISLKTEIENQGNVSRKKVTYNNINETSYNLIENLSSDEDEAEAEKWEPLALEITKNQKIVTKNKFSDIISTLVYIFGSPEEFVEHYKRMLAERSVSDEMSKFSIETEIKNLELLKVKFGENYFQSCEVLIKDVKDSIKMNKSLQQQTALIKGNEGLIYTKKESKF